MQSWSLRHNRSNRMTFSETTALDFIVYLIIEYASFDLKFSCFWLFVTNANGFFLALSSSIGWSILMLTFSDDFVKYLKSSCDGCYIAVQ
jgi:hypothetical protein